MCIRDRCTWSVTTTALTRRRRSTLGWSNSHASTCISSPTSSSWINQVERWFGFITDELIRSGNHQSVQAFEADIRAWAKGWNEDPKLFIWTKSVSYTHLTLPTILRV